MNASASSRSGQVLVAVDGSPAAIEALRYGGTMAAMMGARLTVVTVWQPLRHGILPPLSTHPYQAAEQLVAQCVQVAFRGGAVPDHDTVAIEGDPVDGLVGLSRDADLLVVGSRGHSGLAGALLGSVSAACAARAHCPVTVVRALHEAGAGTGAAARPQAGELAADDRIVVTF